MKDTEEGKLPEAQIAGFRCRLFAEMPPPKLDVRPMFGSARLQMCPLSIASNSAEIEAAWHDLQPPIAAFSISQSRQSDHGDVDDEGRDHARSLSPESFLRSRYPVVRLEHLGRRISVYKVLRADFRYGIWVACD